MVSDVLKEKNVVNISREDLVKNFINFSIISLLKVVISIEPVN